MLQEDHSVILSTFIKQSFVNQIFVLSIFLKTRQKKQNTKTNHI